MGTTGRPHTLQEAGAAPVQEIATRWQRIAVLDAARERVPAARMEQVSAASRSS